jgi:membrane protein YdbS with pleckstrin-like domain
VSEGGDVKPLNRRIALGVALLIAIAVGIRVWGARPWWLVLAEGIAYVALAAHAFAFVAEQKRQRQHRPELWADDSN